MTANARDLVKQGVAALQAGDKTTARSLFIQAARLLPHNQNIWLWLSDAVDTDSERRECLERVLSIDPSSKAGQTAQKKLSRLSSAAPSSPMSALAQSAPAPAPPAPRPPASVPPTPAPAPPAPVPPTPATDDEPHPTEQPPRPGEALRFESRPAPAKPAPPAPAAATGDESHPTEQPPRPGEALRFESRPAPAKPTPPAPVPPTPAPPAATEDEPHPTEQPPRPGEALRFESRPAPAKPAPPAATTDDEPPPTEQPPRPGEALRFESRPAPAKPAPPAATTDDEPHPTEQPPRPGEALRFESRPAPAKPAPPAPAPSAAATEDEPHPTEQPPRPGEALRFESRPAPAKPAPPTPATEDEPHPTEQPPRPGEALRFESRPAPRPPAPAPLPPAAEELPPPTEQPPRPGEALRFESTPQPIPAQPAGASLPSERLPPLDTLPPIGELSLSRGLYHEDLQLPLGGSDELDELFWATATTDSDLPVQINGPSRWSRFSSVKIPATPVGWSLLVAVVVAAFVFIWAVGLAILGDSEPSDNGLSLIASDVVSHFQRAGLEAADPRPVQESDYGEAAHVCMDGSLYFALPSIGPDARGLVFDCDDSDNIRTLTNFYEQQNRPVRSAWYFDNSNMLVVLDGRVPPVQAQQYERAFNELFAQGPGLVQEGVPITGSASPTVPAATAYPAAAPAPLTGTSMYPDSEAISGDGPAAPYPGSSAPPRATQPPVRPPRPTVLPTPTEEPAATSTPESAPEEEPTATESAPEEEPTATESAPEEEPTATESAPEEEPTATESAPGEEPLVFGGSGQFISDTPFSLPAPISRVVAEHSGEGNFALTILSADGEIAETLIDTAGAYAGMVLFAPEAEDGRYTLEVTAESEWSVAIEPVPLVEEALETISGSGDFVSDLFVPAQVGPVDYLFTHDGEQDFVVFLRCGANDDLVQDTTGVVDNQGTVRFTEGPCLWHIRADGDWSIIPSGS